MNSSLPWYNAPEMIVLNKAENSIQILWCCPPRLYAFPSRVYSLNISRVCAYIQISLGALAAVARRILVPIGPWLTCIWYMTLIIGPNYLPPSPLLPRFRIDACVGQRAFHLLTDSQAPLQASRPMISISPRLINECGLYMDFFTQSVAMRGVYSSAGYNRVRAIFANLRYIELSNNLQVLTKVVHSCY